MPTKELKPQVPAIKKVYIACPNSIGFGNDFVKNLLAYNCWLLGVARIEITCPRTFDEHPISIARNKIIEEAMKDPKVTHIFMYDADQVLQVSTIYHLMKRDMPVVSGWYLSRKGTGLPVVLKRLEPIPKEFPPKRFPAYHSYTLDELFDAQQQDGLVKAHGVGGGCLLIKREVVPRLSTPYFKEYWGEKDNKTGHKYGEDLYFSLNCEFHKVPIYVDMRQFCGHIGWINLDETYLREFVKRRQAEKKTKK